ncbi:hypothetical protein C8J56DRAFT_1112406 [Mycena floridula]|nr:hypothetical protein C8J56DRAFT_1112406 [Mycena floridula]
MAKPSLVDICSILSQSPTLLQQLTIDDVLTFIRLTAGLKNDILFGQKPSHNPETIPQELPQNVLSFLSSTMNLSSEHIHYLWDTFRVTIWTENHCPKEQAAQDRARFHENSESELMLHALYPPVHFCVHADCPSKTRLLWVKPGSSQRRKVVLFTLSDGAVATYHVKLICKGSFIVNLLQLFSLFLGIDCNTSYHHNFYVQNKVCVYYDGVPKVVKITKHHYAESTVLCLFIAQMLNAWHDWGESNFDFESRTEHIWEGIIMLCLLEDYADRSTILSVLHDGEAKDRFTAAVQERNERDDGKWYKVSAIVSDGVTIGHPCCGVIHCPEPLEHRNSRFCAGHSFLHKLCAVEGCSEPVAQDRLTCIDPEHQQLENRHRARNIASFERKKRAQRQQVSTPADEDADIPDEGIEEEECPSKHAEGNRILRAMLGRRQTHNEQLMIRPCGIIVARGTFYGSETIPQVVDMLKKTFRVPGSMPDLFIYDTCCGVYNHLSAIQDPILETTGFPVDLFHFECKHKKTDTVCQQHCNPALFPKMINPDGSSYFNTSVFLLFDLAVTAMGEDDLDDAGDRGGA